MHQERLERIGLVPSMPRLLTARTLSILSYNVAGLPQWMSTSRPRDHAPLISPLLNGYDIVLLQEDFVYHNKLAQSTTHEHSSAPNWPRIGRRPHALTVLGDGLNRFSRWPFDKYERVPWQQCYGVFSSGSDCLAAKGFTFAQHYLREAADTNPACWLSVYNIHCDAGHNMGDREARRMQLAQLTTHIHEHADVRMPCIVAGDTNLEVETNEYDRETLHSFLRDTRLLDSRQTARVRQLEQPRPLSSNIDMILYRSGTHCTLRPRSWRLCTDEFLTDGGEPLSDHNALCVDFVVGAST